MPVDYPLQYQAANEKGEIETKQGIGRYYREYWMPSEKDLENLQAGRGIVIDLYCAHLTPVAMFTFDENGNVEQPVFDDKLKPE